MLHKKIINIKKDKIIISKAEEFIKSSAYGASIIFNGTVRNNNENKEVIGMTYDSHDELVLKSFEGIYRAY
jgi:molybdopterin synthase catalytic subunit